MADELCSDGIRGLILGTFDIESEKWKPALVIPHHTGPRIDDTAAEASLNFPDVSYAWIRNEGDQQFTMAYYEGYKGSPSDIRVARMMM
jgi:hypothetical protein